MATSTHLSLDSDSLIRVINIVKDPTGVVTSALPLDISIAVLASLIAGAGVEVSWDDVTGKPETFPATLGTGATDALAGDTPILSEAAITAIGALTDESTAAEIVAALQA